MGMAEDAARMRQEHGSTTEQPDRSLQHRAWKVIDDAVKEFIQAAGGRGLKGIFRRHWNIEIENLAGVWAAPADRRHSARYYLIIRPSGSWEYRFYGGLDDTKVRGRAIATSRSRDKCRVDSGQAALVRRKLTEALSRL